MKNQSKYTTYFWVISVLLAFAKIAFTLRPEIDLFTEEAQYWLWSQNMAWHYYSKPPMVAVLNFLSTGLLGKTEITVRLNAIILGVGMSWFTFLLGRQMYSDKVGFWAAMLLQGMPLWWLASTFHMTDTALTFFWTLSLYAAYRALESQKVNWWILAGLATACGIMSKVVMILMPAMLLIYLLFTREFKRNFTHYSVFVLVSLIGFTPMLIWNWQNDFYTFRHLAALGRGGGDSQSFDLLKSLGRFGAYLGGQLAMLSPFILPLVWGFFSRKRLLSDYKTIFLLLPMLMSFMAFGLLSFMTDIEVNWPVFAYSGFSIALAAWLVNQSGFWLKARNWGLGLSLGIPLFFLLPDITFLKSIKPIKSAEKAVFRRNSAYQPLAERLDFLRDSLSAKEAFVFSETYHMASELSFYLQGHPQTYMVNMGSRKNQFDLWPGLEQFEGEKKKGIFVSWNYDSPGEFVEFGSLLYEEKFEISFKGLPHRVATIQIWEDLIDYKPFVPDSF
ncbi:ArnT family glycosyltransferase [Algoriphagus namhaensis]|uniref:ArnT family glycosyltransferase n=1 Tax=Algoriphagus namhaensis TaxID=915353 RepID=A0ABV8ANB6_9BACT